MLIVFAFGNNFIARKCRQAQEAPTGRIIKKTIKKNLAI